jgi:dienelactone hydrolase
MRLLGKAVAIPAPSGPHAIGTARYEVSEDGYVDPYAPAPAPRRVPVQAWYPAQVTDGPGEPGLDEELRAALSAMTRVPKFLLRPGRTAAIVNAPAVPGRYPVLIFNHGYGSFQKQSTSLLGELASHGYVVLSVGHPYESLAVRYADGTVIRWRSDLPAWATVAAGLKELEPNLRAIAPLFERARAARNATTLRDVMSAIAAQPSYAALVPVLEVWTHDTRVVLDTLGHLDAGALAPPLRGLVDASRVGAFGHSLGGILAGQLAMTEPRIRAAMNFDGAQLPPPHGPYALAAPCCFVYADTLTVGQTSSANEGVNDALTLAGPPGSCGACIVGAGHLNFTDMNNMAMMSKALGPIDRGVMARTLRAMTVGFFDHHLKGAPLAGFGPSPTLRVHWPSGAPA